MKTLHPSTFFPLTGLILVGLGGWMPLNAIAQVKQASTALQARPTPQAQTFRGTPIPPSQVQSMWQELMSLIEQYELTLASAGVLEPMPHQSTQDLLTALVSGQQNPSGDHKIPASYAGIWNALSQAKDYRQAFQEQIEAGDFTEARQSWVKARNLLQDNFPTGLNSTSPNIRAMWLDRGTIVQAQSAKDLKLLFDRMKRAGINVVFFEVVNAGYPIYPSQVAPQQNPLVKNWDPLKEAIALAHDRDMELHAWVWTFATVNQKHNEILGLPKTYPGPVLAQHPEWAIADRRGNLPEWISGKSFLDPANPEVREYLTRLFSEIVSEYEVDGLQLDYIRYPFQNPAQGNIHGYSVSARQQFQRQYGLDPLQITPGHPRWTQWLNFKTEQIDTFVQETAKHLKQIRPDLTISAAVFPLPEQERYTNLQQNWQRWVKEGWVDLLLPMTYATDTEAFRAMTDPLLQPEYQGSSLVIPGLRLLNMPSYKTVQQVQYVQQLPTPGYSLFAAAHFQSALASTLNRPDLAAPKPPLPHRMPIEAAIAEYEGLTREWHYWLEQQSHNATAIASLPTLQPWAKSVDQFAQTLTSIKQEAKATDWQRASQFLTGLRQTSSTWMTNQPFVREEQRDRWLNRLQRIQVLLTYAEKKAKMPSDSVAQRGGS